MKKAITVTRHGKPYEMTLDKVWSECLRMWKRVAKQSTMPRDLIKRNEEVEALKGKWLKRNGYSGRRLMRTGCFFCTWSHAQHRGKWGSCRKHCPGAYVLSDFDCFKTAYSFNHKPRGFCRKLVALNKKRRGK